MKHQKDSFTTSPEAAILQFLAHNLIKVQNFDLAKDKNTSIKLSKPQISVKNLEAIVSQIKLIKENIFRAHTDQNMTESQSSLPKWILIVSGIFALLEIMVSFALCFSPQSVAESVDLKAKGVDFLIYMWAARQFALGVIFGFATIKKSIPMLTISYIFFLVMFVGDLIIGVLQKDNGLIISALLMCIISSAMILVLNNRK